METRIGCDSLLRIPPPNPSLWSAITTAITKLHTTATKPRMCLICSNAVHFYRNDARDGDLILIHNMIWYALAGWGMWRHPPSVGDLWEWGDVQWGHGESRHVVHCVFFPNGHLGLKCYLLLFWPHVNAVARWHAQHVYSFIGIIICARCFPCWWSYFCFLSNWSQSRVGGNVFFNQLLWYRWAFGEVLHIKVMMIILLHKAWETFGGWRV